MPEEIAPVSIDVAVSGKLELDAAGFDFFRTLGLDLTSSKLRESIPQGYYTQCCLLYASKPEQEMGCEHEEKSSPRQNHQESDSQFASFCILIIEKINACEDEQVRNATFVKLLQMAGGTFPQIGIEKELAHLIPPGFPSRFLQLAMAHQVIDLDMITSYLRQQRDVLTTADPLYLIVENIHILAQSTEQCRQIFSRLKKDGTLSLPAILANIRRDLAENKNSEDIVVALRILTQANILKPDVIASLCESLSLSQKIALLSELEDPNLIKQLHKKIDFNYIFDACIDAFEANQDDDSRRQAMALMLIISSSGALSAHQVMALVTKQHQLLPNQHDAQRYCLLREIALFQGMCSADKCHLVRAILQTSNLRAIVRTLISSATPEHLYHSFFLIIECQELPLAYMNELMNRLATDSSLSTQESNAMLTALYRHLHDCYPTSIANTCEQISTLIQDASRTRQDIDYKQLATRLAGLVQAKAFRTENLCQLLQSFINDNNVGAILALHEATKNHKIFGPVFQQLIAIETTRCIQAHNYKLVDSFISFEILSSDALIEGMPIIDRILQDFFHLEDVATPSDGKAEECWDDDFQETDAQLQQKLGVVSDGLSQQRANSPVLNAHGMSPLQHLLSNKAYRLCAMLIETQPELIAQAPPIFFRNHLSNIAVAGAGYLLRLIYKHASPTNQAIFLNQDMMGILLDSAIKSDDVNTLEFYLEQHLVGGPVDNPNRMAKTLFAKSTREHSYNCCITLLEYFHSAHNILYAGMSLVAIGELFETLIENNDSDNLAALLATPPKTFELWSTGARTYMYYVNYAIELSSIDSLQTMLKQLPRDNRLGFLSNFLQKAIAHNSFASLETIINYCRGLDDEVLKQALIATTINHIFQAIDNRNTPMAKALILSLQTLMDDDAAYKIKVAKIFQHYTGIVDKQGELQGSPTPPSVRTLQYIISRGIIDIDSEYRLSTAQEAGGAPEGKDDKEHDYETAVSRILESPHCKSNPHLQQAAFYLINCGASLTRVDTNALFDFAELEGIRPEMDTSEQGDQKRALSAFVHARICLELSARPDCQNWIEYRTRAIYFMYHAARLGHRKAYSPEIVHRLIFSVTHGRIWDGIVARNKKKFEGLLTDSHGVDITISTPFPSQSDTTADRLSLMRQALALAKQLEPVAYKEFEETYLMTQSLQTMCKAAQRGANTDLAFLRTHQAAMSRQQFRWLDRARLYAATAHRFNPLKYIVGLVVAVGNYFENKEKAIPVSEEPPVVQMPADYYDFGEQEQKGTLATYAQLLRQQSVLQRAAADIVDVTEFFSDSTTRVVRSQTVCRQAPASSSVVSQINHVQNSISTRLSDIIRQYFDYSDKIRTPQRRVLETIANICCEFSSHNAQAYLGTLQQLLIKVDLQALVNSEFACYLVTEGRAKQFVSYTLEQAFSQFYDGEDGQLTPHEFFTAHPEQLPRFIAMLTAQATAAGDKSHCGIPASSRETLLSRLITVTNWRSLEAAWHQTFAECDDMQQVQALSNEAILYTDFCKATGGEVVYEYRDITSSGMSKIKQTIDELHDKLEAIHRDILHEELGLNP